MCRAALSVTRRSGATWLILVPLLSLVGCAGGDSRGGPPGAALWTVGPEPAVTIGEVEGDAPYLFSGIRAAAILPGGGIAVADGGTSTVRIFSPDGTFVTELGRQGKGPGEFMRISRLVVAPPDTLVVYDSGLFRVSRFLLSGSFLSSVEIQAQDGYPELYLGRFSDGDFCLGWLRQKPLPDEAISTDEMRFARFGGDGRMSDSIGTTTGMRRMVDRDNPGLTPLAFSPHLYAALVGDSILLTNGVRPEIEVWDAHGNVARTIPVPAPEVDPSEAWAALEQELQAHGNSYERQWFQGQPRDVPIPRISMMFVDDQARIWVKEFAPLTDNHIRMTGYLEGGRWLVMDMDGTVAATVELPAGFRIRDVRGNEVLGTVRDDVGVERVQAYHIVD